MISDHAKQGINQIFTRACASLALGADDSVAVDPIKLLIIFHVEANRETQQYFSKPEAGLGFADVFPELANLCCGAMNRELGGYFAHLGMSTPYPLDRQCRVHLTQGFLGLAPHAQDPAEVVPGARGQHVLLAYLPPEQAVIGTELAVSYMEELYPVVVRSVDATSLFDAANERMR